MVERTSVVIYFNNINVLGHLPKEINVFYKSEKASYAILYFDKKKEKDILEKLKSLKEITQIEKSEVPYDKYKF